MADQTSPLGIPGLSFPPRPAVLNAAPITSIIPSQNAPYIPISTLVCSWAKRSHDHLHDLLETLESVKDNETYRRQLLSYFIDTHKSLSKLIVLIEFTINHSPMFARLHNVSRILYSRDFAYQTSVDMLKILANHIDTQMTPIYDVNTALHTLSTGSYRLLPKVIERVVGAKPVLSKRHIATIKQRLDDALHANLLTSTLPEAYSSIRVRGGMAWLTVKNEFIVGVSLRMMPQLTPPVSEDARIKWRLFHAYILVNVDSESQSQHNQSIINDSQLAHLIAHCNAIMHQHDDPLFALYETMHAFVVNLSLSLLQSQAQSLQSAYHHAIKVQYKPSQSLSIQYWPEAESIPIEGHSSKSIEKPVIIMHLIVDHTGSLVVQHQPPLPDMELASQLFDDPSDSPFTVNTSRLSISHLFTLVIASHANSRLARLQSFIIRAAQEQHIDAYLSINLADDSQGSSVQQNRLIIQLSINRSLAVRVDRTSGKFHFAFADSLIDQQGKSNSDELHRSLHKLSEHVRDQRFHDVIPVLADMRTSCVISDVLEQCSIDNILATRSLPIIWTDKQPTPNQPSRLFYIRCRSNPSFYVVCSVELSNNAEASNDSIRSVPIKLFMLHTDDIDHSKVPRPAALQPAFSKAPAKRVRSCLLYPTSLTPIIASDLPSHQLLLTVDGASISIISLITRALLHCETRIPLSLLAAQLQRHSDVTIAKLEWPRKIICTVPFPPPPSPPKSFAQITLRLTPYSPLNNKSTTDRMALARVSAREFGTQDVEAREGRGIDSQPVIRCGWTAVVEYSSMLQVWTDPSLIRARPGQSALLTGMVIVPEVPPADSYRLPLMQYDHISNDSIPHFFNELSRLFLSQYFARETSNAFRNTIDEWQEREKRADTRGFDPVPGFFQLIACSVDGWVIRYDLNRVPMIGTSTNDICTLTIRQRRGGELEPFSYLANMLHKQGAVWSMIASPYPFPHLAFLELEFSQRYDIKQILRHVYWSCVAVKTIHSFMRNISHFDAAAGFHRLALCQVVAFGQPATGPNGATVNTSVNLQLHNGPHTVICIPQSSTRLRFYFRKQGRASKLDVRFVNGYVFVQDFWSPNTSGTNQLSSNGDSPRSPPSRVPLGQLSSLLQSWYQSCGQNEIWRRVVKWQRMPTPPLKIHFERLSLTNQPTVRPLVTMKVATGTDPDCLTEPHANILMRYFHLTVATPPYSGECIMALLSVCNAPKAILLEFLPLLEYECDATSASQAEAFRARYRHNKLVFRWCSWLNTPYSLEVDQKLGVVVFIAELSDKRRGEALYLPLVYSLRSHRIAIWDHEEMDLNTRDPKLSAHTPPCAHSSRKYRELHVDQPMKQWDSLWSFISFLMRFSIGELIDMIGKVTPTVDKTTFGSPMFAPVKTAPVGEKDVVEID